MIKIPKYIKEKMSRVAQLNSMAAREMSIVENWLEEKGFDIDELRCGDGISLDELEFGNDIADELCEKLRKMYERIHRA